MALLLGGGGTFLLQRQWAERRAEQVAQETRLRLGVDAALDEVTGLEGKGRLGEARAVLAQAASQLGEEGPPELRARVERARANFHLVTRLDAARMSRAAMVEGYMDLKGASRRYAAAFAEAGLAGGRDGPAEAASRVRSSAVAGPLVAALDDWAFCAPDAARRAWVLEVARKSDPDRWRDRARQPAVWADRDALKELLAEDEAADESPQLIAALGARLRQLGGDAVGALRRAQARHPDDFWLNFELALQLGKDDPAEAAGYYRAAEALRPDAAVVHNNLALLQYDRGKLREAEAEFKTAIRLDPAFAYPHHNLGNLLRDQGKLQEAEEEYRAALRLDTEHASPHNNLGNALRDQGKQQEAEAEYRAAIRVNSDDPVPHHNLGLVLFGRGKPREAEGEFRAALRLNPTFAPAHYGLGNALKDQGRRQEAEGEFRAAIRLDPTFAAPHDGLGNLLRQQGKLQEAEAGFRAAVRLDPTFAPAHHNLGRLLYDRGKPQDAETQFRAAIRFDPTSAPAHNGLGLALFDQGKRQEAEQEYRTAIRLDPAFAGPHNGLGILLKGRGRFEEARKEFQQALDLGLPGAVEGLRECDRFIPLAARLPAVLRGDDRPADAREMLGFAELCSRPFERRLGAVARFYREAFAADPKLAEDLKAGRRYDAACCAALAGCGQGKDADELGAAERARLRQQALAWLRADLAAWAKQAQQSADRARVRQNLQDWKEDADLAGVRGDALAQLPEAERGPWQKLWADVDALLAAVSASETKR